MAGIATALTNRQLEILELARDGYTGKEIALTLGISPDTVNNQLAAIRVRLSATNTAQAVVIAVRCGFISLLKSGGVING